MNTNTITAEQFIELLKDSDLDSTIFKNKMIVEGDVTIIDIVDYSFPMIEVVNAEFKGKFIFDGLTLMNPVSFQDCLFNKDIRFNKVRKNIKRQDDYIKIGFYGCEISSVDLNNCGNIDGLSIEGNKIKGGVRIMKCEEMKDFFIHDNIELGAIEVNNQSEFKGTLSVYNNKNLSLRLVKSKIEELNIFRNRDNFYWIVLDRIKSQNLNVKENEIVNSIDVHNIQVEIEFTVLDNVIDNQFKLLCGDNTDIKYLSVAGGNYKQGFWIYGFLTIKAIHNILYTGTQENNGSFHFRNLILDCFKLQGAIKSSTIILNNVIVDDLIFDNFFNYGIISLAEVKGTNELKIDHANLGNCEIINCDFSNFKQVNIKNASLASIKSVQTKWFSRTQLNQSTSNTKDLATIKTNREVYRQLKQAMYSQGDTIQALKFKSLEMNEYKHELGFSKWKYKSDWFVMFMNKSNNYGLNWFKPVWIAGVFTFVMYIVLSNCFISHEYATIDKEYFPYLWQHKYRFILLLDPTFKLKDVFDVEKNYELPASMYFFGFIQRIGMTYLIFQTVAAFRKYLK